MWPEQISCDRYPIGAASRANGEIPAHTVTRGIAAMRAGPMIAARLRRVSRRINGRVVHAIGPEGRRFGKACRLW